MAWNTNTRTTAVNRTYAVPTYEVLTEAGGLRAGASAGYAGTPGDQRQQPHYQATSSPITNSTDGDVVLTAQVRFDRSGQAPLWRSASAAR